MNRRFQDKPLWQRVELALVWFVVLAGCVMFWVYVIEQIGELLK